MVMPRWVAGRRLPGGAMFDAQLEGARETEAALRELPRRLAKATVRRALVKAFRPVAEDAGNRIGRFAPRLQGAVRVLTTLSRRHRAGEQRRSDTVYAYLGFTAARYGLAHLFEFGTRDRHHRSGRFTGRMVARGALTEAWEAGKRQAIDRFGRDIGGEIERAAQRLARRAGGAGSGSR